MSKHDFARDERLVRDGFWPKIRPLVAALPFAEDLISAFYCAFDPETPMKVKVVLMGALAYFVLPFDVVPDWLPLLGYGDDAAVLATALSTVRGSITELHRKAARAALTA